MFVTVTELWCNKKDTEELNNNNKNVGAFLSYRVAAQKYIMANTYTQLYYHLVFVVKGRAKLISKEWEEDLYRYINGLIKNRNQKLMKINGMPDHIHLLIGANPSCNLSDLVRDIKVSSTKWINEGRQHNPKFNWQIGFAAFTKGQSQVGVVSRYIENQKKHHRTKTTKEEYVELLVEYGIDYKEEYLFDL